MQWGNMQLLIISIYCRPHNSFKLTTFFPTCKMRHRLQPRDSHTGVSSLHQVWQCPTHFPSLSSNWHFLKASWGLQSEVLGQQWVSHRCFPFYSCLLIKAGSPTPVKNTQAHKWKVLILIYSSNTIQEPNSSTSQTRPGSTKASWSWPLLTVLSAERTLVFSLISRIMRSKLLPKITSTVFGSEAKKLLAQPTYLTSQMSLSQAVWSTDHVTPISQTKSTEEISAEAGVACLLVWTTHMCFAHLRKRKCIVVLVRRPVPVHPRAPCIKECATSWTAWPAQETHASAVRCD